MYCPLNLFGYWTLNKHYYYTVYIIYYGNFKKIASENLPSVQFRFMCIHPNRSHKFCLDYSSSVYSPFSDRVGLPPHNTPPPGVLMKSNGALFLRPDVLPDVNHTRGMQYQTVLNIIFWPEIN